MYSPVPELSLLMYCGVQSDVMGIVSAEFSSTSMLLPAAAAGHTNAGLKGGTGGGGIDADII